MAAPIKNSPQVKNQSSPFVVDWLQAFRILGAPSRFVRANLMLIWLVGIFLFWLTSPVKAIPHPTEIWQAFQRMWALETQANLVYSTYLTLKLNLFGLFWATSISLIISYFSVIPLLKPLNQFVQWLRYIPIVSFNLIFLFIFGIGSGIKIAMFAAGISFFLITGMTAEINSIPRLKFELARVLNYSDWRVFYTVVFRPTMPAMIDLIAQNAAIGWIMIVTIESFNRTEGGIGAQICAYAETNQQAEIYVYLFIIGIVAILEDQFFVWIKRLFFPYTMIHEKS
ncbi:MAG TPA: ABC transporter permease subunit [Pyrinomonadaceae bacterium]|nr:ABC transporter permease subunit [Pyrinomonadaceae bacterium]